MCGAPIASSSSARGAATSHQFMSFLLMGLVPPDEEKFSPRARMLNPLLLEELVECWDACRFEVGERDVVCGANT